MRAVNLPSPGPRGQPNGNGGHAKPRSRSSIDLATAALTWLATWVVGNLLAAVVIGASGHAGDSTKPLWVNVVGAMCLWTPMLLGLLYVSRTIGGGTLTVDYGFRFEPIDFIGIPIGVLSQLVLLRLIYWPLEQWWPSTFARDKVEQTARDLSDTASSGWLVALLVAIVVIGAPVVEELMYRGLLQGAFIRRLSEPVGVRGGGGLVRGDPLPARPVPGPVRLRAGARDLRAAHRPARDGDRRAHGLQRHRSRPGGRAVTPASGPGMPGFPPA